MFLPTPRDQTTPMKPVKWIVGLVRDGPCYYIRVQASPAAARVICPVLFVERRARVAARRYIRGNLSAALVCLDDGANTPADVEKSYARNLRRRMIPGTGPGGFRVDYE